MKQLGTPCRHLLGWFEAIKKLPLLKQGHIIIRQFQGEECFPQICITNGKKVLDHCEMELKPCFQELEAEVPKPNPSFLSGGFPEMCAVH